MLFICYPKCTTCRKARSFLESTGAVFTERNIKDDKPSLSELEQWHAKSGLPLKNFFNTSGTLYKEMKLKEKLPSMNDQEQLALLASDGMLVKRPILTDGERVLVGFKESEWETFLHRSETED